MMLEEVTECKLRMLGKVLDLERTKLFWTKRVPRNRRSMHFACPSKSALASTKFELYDCDFAVIQTVSVVFFQMKFSQCHIKVESLVLVSVFCRAPLPSTQGLRFGYDGAPPSFHRRKLRQMGFKLVILHVPATWSMLDWFYSTPPTFRVSIPCWSTWTLRNPTTCHPSNSTTLSPKHRRATPR